MAVDDGNRSIVIDTDMIWLNPHNRTIFLVCFMNKEGSFTQTGGNEEP